MALTVGELVAYIRADNTDFERGLSASERGLSAFGGKVKSGMTAVAGQFTATATAVAGIGIATAKVGWDYNRLQQNSRAALSTLLGGAEAANAQMAKLDDFAKNSPFSKSVFITAQQQLLGFGVEAERVIPIMDAIQQSVAAVGGSNDQIASVSLALAQMQGQGKLTGETLNQLGQYGIDAAGIIATQMGITGAEVRELASKPGGIPVDQIWDPLVNGLMEKFGGATAGIKEQYDGAVDRIGAATRSVGALLAAPFVDPNGGGRAVTWSNEVADAIRALEKQTGPLVDLFLMRFQPALEAVSPALKNIKDNIAGLDLSKFADGLATAGEYTPLIAGLAAALIALGGPAVLGSFGLVVPALSPVTAGLAALIATSPELRGLAGDLLSVLQPVVPAAREAGTALADGFLKSVDTLTPSLDRLIQAIGPVVAAFATSALAAGVESTTAVVDELVPAVADLIDAAVPLAAVLGDELVGGFTAVVSAGAPLVGVLADVVGWVAELPGPVVGVGVAMLALTTGPLGALTRMLGGATVAAFGAARTAATTLSTSMAASQGVAAAMGTQVSRMGALAMTARAGVSSLSGAMTAAFIGNPVTVAIVGIATALGIYIAKQQTAKALTESYRSTLDDLGNTTMDTTSKINQAFLESNSGWMNSGQDIADIADKIGVSLETYRHAVMGNETALAAVTEAGQRYIDNGSLMDKATSSRKYEVRDLTNSIDQQKTAVEGAVESEKALIEANGESSRQAEVNADRIKATTDALNANTDAALRNAGELLGAREAERQYADTVQSVSEKIAENQKALEDSNLSEADRASLLRDSAGELDKLAEASLRTIEADRKQGVGQDQLTAKTQTLRDALISQAEQLGMTAEEATAYADELGLVPGEIKTVVRVETEVAKAQLEQWKTSINSNPYEVPTTVIVDQDGIERAVVDFAALGKMEPTVKVFADGAAALAEGQNTVEAIDQTGKDVQTWTIDADGNLALTKGRETETALSSLNPRAIAINGDGNPARAAGTAAVADINRKSATVTVNAAPSAGFAGQVAAIRAQIPSLFGFAAVPGKAGGGAISGPGTGTSDDVLIAASNGEHMLTADEVQKAGGHAGVYRLRNAIKMGKLPAFATGGAIGPWEDRSRSAMADAQAAWNRGDEDAWRAADTRYREAQSVLARLWEERATLQRSSRRGTDVTRATSSLSGAMSVVDQVWEASKNANYTQGSRNNLHQVAAQAEPALRRLYDQAEKIDTKLADARDRVEELSRIKTQVGSLLAGEFQLSDSISKATPQQRGNKMGDIWYDQKPASVRFKDVLADARNKAGKLKAFASKLDALAKLGLNGTLLRELAELGSEEGMLVANELAKAGKGGVGQLNAAYKQIEQYSGQAGEAATKGWYKGGISAAEGLVLGLESQESKITKSIEKIAQGMIKALRKSLGIASPAKALISEMEYVGDGAVVGIDRQLVKTAAAAARLGDAAVPDLSGVDLTVPGTAGRATASGAVQVLDPRVDVTVHQTVYVQDPFTGALLEAKLVKVADDRIEVNAKQVSRGY